MIADQECKQALKYFNTGQWLQLEGSIGRWVNEFLELKIILQDKKNGTVSIVDGYGRPVTYNRGHIDWDKVNQINEEE